MFPKPYETYGSKNSNEGSKRLRVLLKLLTIFLVGVVERKEISIKTSQYLNESLKFNINYDFFVPCCDTHDKNLII